MGSSSSSRSTADGHTASETPATTMSMGSPPHALVLPYPAQGHVIPLVELSHRLVDLGFAVTFVTTEHTHRHLLAALPEPPAAATPAAARYGRLRLVAVPDGLPHGDDRADIGRLTAAIQRAMPGHLEELIRETNEPGAGGGGITCVVADQGMAWALGVAGKMGLPAAAFWPASAAMLATILSIPKLVEDGIIDQDGHLRREGEFQLAVGMPAMNRTHLAWNYCGDAAAQSVMFRYFQSVGGATASSEFILCNSFPEIEGPVFAYAPRILPVGPLLARHRRRRGGDVSGHFLPEDPGCAAWLDGQLPGSVIYAAFGSSTILGRRQFQELARGLELSGRPFLWVARPGLAETLNPKLSPFPEGFHRRVGSRGRVVGWAPQQEVLAYPAVACFVSHCGWNSAVEGAASGVPFLCWPYFGDQFANRDYICGVWGTGLSVAAPGGDGVVAAEEIRGKLEALLGDEGIRGRAARIREAAGRSGAGGCENLNRLVEAMKAGEGKSKLASTVDAMIRGSRTPC